MENPVRTQTFDGDSLLVASLILMDVNQTVRDIRMLVTALLRFVAIGASITDRLMGMIMPALSEAHSQ